MAISSSRARTSAESFFLIARNSRSNAGVVRTRNGPAIRLVLSTLFLPALAARSFQFSQEFPCTPRRSPAIFRRARLDLLLYRVILHFEVILKVVHMQEASDGDAVFFQNEDFAVHVHPAHNLAEIHTRFGQG